MARRKNVKRIDPRYFLHETVFREGDEAEMAQAGEAALADMGEEEILAQVAQLPPEVQAEIEAAATATAEEASQLKEAFRDSETLQQRMDRERGEMYDKLGAIYGAGAAGAVGAAAYGALVGVSATMVAGLAASAFAAGMPIGAIVAAVAIKASRMLQDADPEQPRIDKRGEDPGYF